MVAFPRSSQHATAGPYSPIVVVRGDAVLGGDLIALSGQGPLDMAGAVVGEGIREQTRVALENCRRQLAVAGADLGDVIKVNAYLADLADWDDFNAEYVTHFAEPRPVRTTVGVRLLLGMRIELDLWAVR